MLFLVDYENVGNMGMKGCHYLNALDYMIIFYSETRKNMERRFLENIASSGCAFEICKLYKNGKNALDFYIASKLGELVGSGFDGTVAIISHDNGYQAVQDYWEKKAVRKRRVLLSACVEDGIAGSNEDSERARELKRLRENVAIGEFFNNYGEKLRIKSVIERFFDGIAHEKMTEQIQELVEKKEKLSV